MIARRWPFAFWLLMALEACCQVEADDATIGMFLSCCVSLNPCNAACTPAVLSPLEYVAYEGNSNTTFSCTLYTTSTSAPSVVWYIDGHSYSTGHADRSITVSEGTMVDESTLQGTLTVDAVKANSNTTIHCVGLFTHIVLQVVRSEDATFMVQGIVCSPHFTCLSIHVW